MNYLSKIFNQRTALIFPTVLLAALQSYFSHIATSCYGHEIFSIYFFIEVFILLLLLFTRLKSNLSILIYFSCFLFEVIYFFLTERPINLDIFLILIVGIIRIYSFVGLLKIVRNKIQ